MRYLKGTVDGCLVYKRSDSADEGFVVYVDSAFENESDRKSSTGFAIFYRGCLVSWGTKRQPIVTLSTTEAEYVAMVYAAQECIGLKNIMCELGFDEKIILYEDNRGAICLAESEGITQRSKHIDLRYHGIREQVKRKTITIAHVATNDMIADHYTKPLGQVKFQKFRSKLMDF
ncbi:hypothetical protein LEN26_011775 [Aphanomyces euteiches]|nr:hypothetical protein LEN26_011775 [Aphanomyces euteiches]